MKNKSKQHSLKANLHTSLLDSCFILDSLWNGDPERYTTPNIHLIPGTLLGADGTAESSAPNDKYRSIETPKNHLDPQNNPSANVGNRTRKSLPIIGTY